MPNQYWQPDPWFWNENDDRREAGKNVVGLIVGPPGIGKSYWGLRVCEKIHERWRLAKFDGNGIVFNAHQFWIRMRDSEEWAWTLWDEPNKGLSHRDWYEEMNKAVTTFIQTFRFKHKSLLLALPSSRLVDKSARAVSLFETQMKQPGLGKVFQLVPNHFSGPEFWKYGRGEVQLHMPSRSLVKDYESKKEDFHKKDYPEEAFVEASEPRIEDLRGWKRIYALVKQDPEHYKVEDPRNPQTKRFSARTISALLDCSDNTARRVTTKLEFESRVQPLAKEP